MSLLNRAKKSVNARFIQPATLKNFRRTKYGKEILKLKDKYKGRRCFLVGNGPSLKAEDLTTLYNNNEITFGFNRVYNIFEDTPWRPDFYISQDEKMLDGCKETVSSLDLKCKLIPIQMDWYFNIKINNATQFNLKPQVSENPDEFLFSDDAADCLYNSGTGMYTAVQLAAYMGIKEIYFIGVDHHFHTSINNKGEIVIDNTVKDYFTDKYNQDKNNLFIPNTEKSTLTYVAMKRHCKDRGISVYNATRGGKLEVFERVDFDKVTGR